MKKNLEIRLEALKNGLYLCQIAEAMHTDRYKFYEDLRRKELTEAEKIKVFETIEGLSTNNG